MWRQRADLGAVELQLVVGDPPGLAVLQLLGRLLLHVVFLQPIRLDHLLEGRHAATRVTVSILGRGTPRVSGVVWSKSLISVVLLSIKTHKNPAG